MSSCHLKQKRDFKIPFLDLKAQYQTIKSKVDAVLGSVLEESAFIKGRYVDSFENDFAKAYGVRHCISVANGTDALYISLKMLGIGVGDEVLTTAFSWVSTCESICQTGASPVFLDIESMHYTLDPEKVESKISSKTKAILVVHLYGQSCDIEMIQLIAQGYGLFLIEDCAQAHFARYKGSLVGTFGIVSTFSFYPSKNLGAFGDAGAVITNNDDLARKVRLFANHGALKKGGHEIQGINSRMDGIQAGILSVKLGYIHDWNRKRYEKALLYTQNLPSFIKTPRIRKGAEHVFHTYVIRSSQRELLREYLFEHGIATRIHYPVALPFMRPYRFFGSLNCELNHELKDSFPVAFQCQQEVLSLPIYPELSDAMIHFVIQVIQGFENN